MKRICIVDCETTGLVSTSDRVVEVAAILYSVEHDTVLEAYSSLIAGESNACAAINRIPEAALFDAAPAAPVWATIRESVSRGEAIVAYNADFDRSFFPDHLQSMRPWICAMQDIQWPKQSKPGQTLVALALEHDLGVAVAHRAMADCELIARLFMRARELGSNIEGMLGRALRPKALFQSKAPFAENDKVKAAGFRWEPDNKRWVRRMAIEDVAALPFKVVQL